MSDRELVEWMRFEATASPLPDRLTDVHFAIISSLIVNYARSSESPPVTVNDFLITRNRTDDELQARDDGRSEAERLQAIWRGG